MINVDDVWEKIQKIVEGKLLNRDFITYIGLTGERGIIEMEVDKLRCLRQPLTVSSFDPQT